MKYTEYILEKMKEFLAIPSPSGFTDQATAYLMKEFQALGYNPVETVKGAVVVDLGGEDVNNGILISGHMDTLGAVVTQIKDTGRLKMINVGGLRPQGIECENCTVHTRDGRVYSGTIQLVNPSTHVNEEYSEIKRSYENIELVLDEMVSSKKDVQDLGIMAGDFVCLDPKTVITESGYIKSRFLDDKISCAILMGYAKYLKEENILPKRRVHLMFTNYEEVGHGGASGIPAGVTEVLGMDMGCVGEGLEGDETKVCICAKDGFSPYDYQVTSALINACKDAELNFAVDVYTNYASDVDVTLKAGYDVRHGLFGPGVASSHGYERSHVQGVENSFRLLQSYLG